MDQTDSGVQCAVDSSLVEWERRDAASDPPLYQCKVAGGEVGGQGGVCHAHCLLFLQAPDDLRLSLLVMRKTLSVMQVLTLWQCGGSFHCLPR